MITFEDILNKSIDYPNSEVSRKQIRFETPELIISIVGGEGTYGDFNKTFEIAILDKKTKEFMTDFFYPTLSDYSDVLCYVSREKMLEIVNNFIK